MSNSVFFKVFSLRSSGEGGAVFADTSAAEWGDAIDQAVLHQCAPLFREHLRELNVLHAMPDTAQERLTQLTR